MAESHANDGYEDNAHLLYDDKGTGKAVVFMDGKQVLSAKDSTYPTGGTGLRSWDSTSACLNDFSISQTP